MSNHSVIFASIFPVPSNASVFKVFFAIWMCRTSGACWADANHNPTISLAAVDRRCYY